MTFPKIFNRIALDAEDNIITDGCLTVSYQDLPFIFDDLEQSINSDHCVAYECINSVPSALMLMFFLKKGISFVLLPGSGQKTGYNPDIPDFCQYQISITPSLKKSAWKIKDYLKIKKNPLFVSPQECLKDKLYLRTSGSMGASKIVVHTHQALLSGSQHCARRYQIQKNDRVAIPIPIFHLYGLGAAFLSAVLSGACIDLQDKVHIIKYLDREKKFNPNIAFMTPALCAMFPQTQKTRAYKLVVTSGQRIKTDIFRKFDLRCQGSLVGQYGSTEMGAIAVTSPDDPLEIRSTAIGKPLPGVELKINPQGELICKHAFGFQGYLDQKGQMTAPQPWFSTGDLASQNPDGSIKILGRCDHSINRSGFLVLLSEIEQTMEKIEGLEQVVVVKVKEQQIAAFCVLQGQLQKDCSYIRKLCLQKMPRYAVPDHIMIVKSIGLLPSGKIDRQTLVEKYEIS